MKKAKWIWQNAFNNTDEYVRFFDEFFYDGDKGELTLDISCDSNYALYLNGELKAFGQYADYPHYKVYDSLALKNVKSGTNKLEIIVWYYGHNFSTYFKGNAGLIYELKQNGEVLSFSGEHIKCTLTQDYVCYQKRIITAQLGFSFKYDTNYQNDSLNFSNAQSAVERKDLTYNLHPRPIKKLELKPFTQAKLINNALSIYDLGCERVGFVKIRFKAPKGAVLNILFSEHIENGFVRQHIDHRDFSFQIVGNGEVTEYMNPFRRFGCRYLQVECDDVFEVLEIGICETVYPVESLPFKAKTQLQQQIYDVSVRTLELCMHEHYEDCPWREQALYAMDSRNQMLCGYYAFKGGNFEFARANLQLMSKAQKSDKLLPLCFPAGVDVPIPFFSLIYLTQMYEYAFYSGDLSLINESFNLLCDIVNVFVEKIEGNGLVAEFESYWNFYEWSKGLDGVKDGRFIHTNFQKNFALPLNCHLILALVNLEKICTLIDKPFKYKKYVKTLQEAVFNNFYVPERKLFKSFVFNEPHFSQYCNSLAILCGCANKYEREICEKIVQESNEITETTLSFKAFFYDALLSVSKDYEKFVIDEIEKNYGYMLKCGATSFWETILGYKDFDEAGSLCHGWSAIPVYYYNKLLKA